MVENVTKSWEKAAGRRHLMLMILVLTPTLIAGAYMATALPNRGAPYLEVAVAFFSASFLDGFLSDSG